MESSMKYALGHLMIYGEVLLNKKKLTKKEQD